jgi:enolase
MQNRLGGCAALAESIAAATRAAQLPRSPVIDAINGLHPKQPFFNPGSNGYG